VERTRRDDDLVRFGGKSTGAISFGDRVPQGSDAGELDADVVKIGRDLFGRLGERPRGDARGRSERGCREIDGCGCRDCGGATLGQR
jgi:hypothetical protein